MKSRVLLALVLLIFCAVKTSAHTEEDCLILHPILKWNIRRYIIEFCMNTHMEHPAFMIRLKIKI